jgi:hypothetical protein
LWLNYRNEIGDDPAWNDFFFYNDIGLPLAYILAEGIAEKDSENQSESIIEETWNMLCKYIAIDPNKEYEAIEDLFVESPQPKMAEVNAESN